MPEETAQTRLLRLAAFVVDALVFSLSLMLPATVASYAAARIGDPKAVSLVWWVAFALLLSAMLLRDGYRGRSPGKRLLGLKITTPSGVGCSYLRSVMRNVPLLLFPIELLLVVVGRGGARLGDRIAKTSIAEE